ncbi:MAG TPA: NAD(P)H-hydrate dehydratase [Oscillospiraceae bacterium]|nr:NAD(P)H-hydrate dehydratase [Oscillospiraceae bacterium]
MVVEIAAVTVVKKKAHLLRLFSDSGDGSLSRSPHTTASVNIITGYEDKEVGEMNVVTAAEMRAIDQKAIAEYGIPGIVLMENAGLRLVEAIRQGQYGERIMIIAGCGNNGGDGFVAARHLSAEKDVSVWITAHPEEYSGDALLNLKILEKLGMTVHCLRDKTVWRDFSLALPRANLVVDAIFGTGLSRPLDEFYQQLIQQLNECASAVMAVDLPSGINADTGHDLGAAVRADVTVTFALPKLGHFLYPGAAKRGRLQVVNIGIPPALLSGYSHTLLTSTTVHLPEREANSHKGTFGTVLLVAGSPGFSGAAVLSAAAALRGGCGLVQLAIPRSIHSMVAAQAVEAITVSLPVDQTGQLQATALTMLQEKWPQCHAVAIGPGLTQREQLLPLLAGLLKECNLPVVLDADALNLLTLAPELLRERQAPTILTPHPGEAARLLGQTTQEVQTDRLAAAQYLAKHFRSTVVLKGAHTIVADPDGAAAINSSGNNGMATAGSGDVLTGLLVSLVAQGLPAAQAARLAVYWHGLAGDLAAHALGKASLVARDLLDYLPQAYLEISKIDI